MRRSPRPRKTAETLPAHLHQRLTAYALTAGATGVTLLALAKPSEAEIVYTPADQTIGRNGSYNLDLNHDGITDFRLSELAKKGLLGGQSSTQSLVVKGVANNRVNCVYPYCLSTFIYAAALRPGSEIGLAQAQHGWLPGFAQMAAEQRRNGNVYYFDSWNNATNHYLGLRFQIDGETHFGWARLTVKFHAGLPQDRTWEAHLTGYAYETIVDQSIKAGQTTEETDEAIEALHPGRLFPGSFVRKPRPGAAQLASLGSLALGASGLALWRRDETEITQGRG
jgi:hypothetical protein